MIRSTASIAAALALAAPGLAQEASSDPAQERTDRVVVYGRDYGGLSLKEYVHEFVLDIADPVGNSRRYGFAAWHHHRTLCVGVSNLDASIAQPIADRISQVILEVGLEPGEPGCEPDIDILFANDGRAVASRLVEEEPSRFRPFLGAGGTTQGWAALQEFATSDAPVRWWQITMVVSAIGPSAARGAPAITLPGWPGPAMVVYSKSASRIRSLTSDELWASYIIVDASKMEGVTVRQLADYLAVVSLAQVDPHASPGGYDTILNLFETSSPPPAMTAWDVSYLHALYDLDRGLKPGFQRRTLVNLMAREQRRIAAGE